MRARVRGHTTGNFAEPRAVPRPHTLRAPGLSAREQAAASDGGAFDSAAEHEALPRRAPRVPRARLGVGSRRSAVADVAHVGVAAPEPIAELGVLDPDEPLLLEVARVRPGLARELAGEAAHDAGLK